MDTELYRGPRTTAEADAARRWGVRFYRDEPAPVGGATGPRAGEPAEFKDSGPPMTDAELETAIRAGEEERQTAREKLRIARAIASDSWEQGRLMTDAEVMVWCQSEEERTAAEEELAVSRAWLLDFVRIPGYCSDGEDHWCRADAVVGDSYIPASHVDDNGEILSSWSASYDPNDPVRPRAVSADLWDRLEPRDHG